MSIKKFLHFSLLILLFSLFACKKVDVQFGSEFVDNEYTQVIKTDTFSADLSTVYVDSFITSGKGVTFVGGYSDPEFGRIDTKCFFEVGPPTYEAIYDSTKFDSLSLILTLNKNSYYGDTLSPLHINVNRLSQQIIFPEGVYSFYNTQQFNYYNTPIGQGDFIIRPNVTDTISIRLDDALGKDLLTKLQNRSDNDMKSEIGFINYFNGIAITSDANAKMILNCSNSIKMRLRYRQPGIDSIQKKYIDFTLANNNHHFNNIKTDRSRLSNGLQNISSTNKEISSIVLNKQAYSQYISGVMTKIKFPTLREILKIDNYAKVLSAQLKIMPVKGTYNNSNFYLPSSLRLSVTDINNTIGGDLGTISSNGTFVTSTGNLYIDNLYGDNTVYTYNVSNYIKQIIKNVGDDKSGLLLLQPSTSYVTQFPRVIIGNKNHPTSKILLEVVYATVK